MKSLLRGYIINVGALAAASQLLPSLIIEGGAKGLMIGGLAFMAANLLLIPVLKLLLLPLNLLTLGLFAWLSNVLALYILVSLVPYFKILPYQFSGWTMNGFAIPPVELSTFQFVVLVSFVIGFTIHFIQWLIK